MNTARFSLLTVVLVRTVAIFMFLGLFLCQAPSLAQTAIAPQNPDLKHTDPDVSSATQNVDLHELSFQSSYSWNIHRVDAEKTFSEMQASSLALSASGFPHIAYGQDHLYYTWYDGGNWHLDTVDLSWGVGTYASLALDSFGRAHISYYDAINKDLKYAQFDGSSWQIETVDQIGNVGEFTSLALDITDHPHISYYDATNKDLKYAYYDGSAWQIETVDSTGDVGQSNSLAVDAQGRPHICYVIDVSGLNCAYLDGSLWYFETVSPSDSWDYISYISLALDSTGLLHISYCNGFSLKYAYFDGTVWQFELVDDQEDYAGLYASLKLDALDRPHISYQLRRYPQKFAPDDIAYLKYATREGGVWDIELVDTYGLTGYFTSLALDTSGRPHISYFDTLNDSLKYTQFDGSVWQLETVDLSLDIGQHSSLVLDIAGYPHVSYFDSTHRSLKYAYFDGSVWQMEIVDNTLYYVGDISLALDTSGRPHISYSSKEEAYTYGTVKYAHFEGSNWQIDTIANMAGDNSIAIDSADKPHIAYIWPACCGGVPDYLEYAYFDGNTWQATTIDSENITSVALALDSLDRPHLSYRKLSLRYAYFDGLSWHIEHLAADGGNPYLVVDTQDRPHITSFNGTVNGVEYAYYNGISWQIEVIDSGGASSIALDSLDHPHLSYYGIDPTEEGALKYATFDGNTWQIETIDSAGEVGLFSSIAIDVSNYAHISYYDATNGDLKYAVDGPPPELTFNHPTGAPGSYINGTGQGFPPNQLAIIHINNIEVGTQLIDATGTLTFTMDTQNSEAGFYLIWVSVNPLNVNPSVFASFTLDPNAPLWSKEGEYPIYTAPATGLKLTFLPIIQR